MPEAQAAKERQLESKAIKERGKVTAPRTSTTDPEARVMKMPDGGYRPAYNVGLATDQSKGVIIGVRVTAQGTDAGEAVPMEKQVVNRTGKQPQSYLMDGGFAISDGYHLPGGTGDHRVCSDKASQNETGGGALSASLR